MEIEGFQSVTDTLLLLSSRPEIADKYEHMSLDPDFFYENMYEVISAVFLDFKAYAVEDTENEIMAFNDPVITDFFMAAARYGKRFNLSDEENPYIKAAKDEARSLFNFSYSLCWFFNWRGVKLADRTRFVTEIYVCEFCEFYELAHSLLTLRAWLTEKLKELKTIGGGRP